MLFHLLCMCWLATPSFQETMLVPELSGYIVAGNSFTEITQRLRASGWHLRRKMDAVYQNFRCHTFMEVEDTFYLYVTIRKGEDYSIWLWMNKDVPCFWLHPEVDELVKEFVDRYAVLANTEVRDRKELLRYYEEALFVLNYIYRKSDLRREQYELSEKSL